MSSIKVAPDVSGLRSNPAILIGLAIALLALCLRYYKISAWPFDGDEFFTLSDIASFETGGKAGPGTGLQGVIPLAYYLNSLGRAWLGHGELGSRVMSALIGSAAIVVVFWGLHKRLGLMAATAAAVLAATWPEHLFQSQQLRHYASTSLFAFLAMVIGATIVEKNSPRAVALTCVALICAFLCHTLSALLIGVVAFGVAAAYWAKGEMPPRPVLIGFALGGAAYLILGFGLVLPAYRVYAKLTADYAQFPSQSIPHMVASFVSLVGWPTVLLAGLGFVLGVNDRRPVVVYWLACMIAVAASLLVLRSVIPYHGTYAFIYALPAFVLAAYAISSLANAVFPKALAGAWLAVMLLSSLNALSTISYYSDGNRSDYRAATQFIRERWQPGDQLVSSALVPIEIYAPELSPRMKIWDAANTSEAFAETVKKAPRTWIIFISTSAWSSDSASSIFFANTSMRLQIMPPRLDHRRRTTQVFLYERDRAPPTPARP